MLNSRPLHSALKPSMLPPSSNRFEHKLKSSFPLAYAFGPLTCERRRRILLDLMASTRTCLVAPEFPVPFEQLEEAVVVGH